MKQLSLAIVALTGLSVGVTTTDAATVTAPEAGDLFVGFRASGGQGAAVSYLVNIGSDLIYRNADVGTSFVVSGLGDLAADLTATYGSNWATRGDLHWGVFGARQSVNSSVYASREQSPVGTISLAWPALTQQARNATTTSVIDVIAGINGFTGSESTANSTVAVLQSNTTNASSYHFQVATAGTTDFGSLSQWSTIEGDFGDGVSGSALDLYRIGGLGVSHVGSFSLTENGALRFAAPVPEPGALLLGIFGAAWGLKRRRTNT